MVFHSNYKNTNWLNSIQYLAHIGQQIDICNNFDARTIWCVESQGWGWGANGHVLFSNATKIEINCMWLMPLIRWTLNHLRLKSMPNIKCSHFPFFRTRRYHFSFFPNAMRQCGTQCTVENLNEKHSFKKIRRTKCTVFPANLLQTIRNGILSLQRCTTTLDPKMQKNFHA